MHAAGIQDLAYSTRWNGTEKVKGLIFFFFFFFFNSRNLFHFSSFTRWFVWHMGRTCPDGLLAVLSTSSKRAKRLSHYEIFFWKGGPTTTFSNPLLPSPRVFCFLSGEMGNNWNFHPHEMAIKRAKKERKNKRREREMERYWVREKGKCSLIIEDQQTRRRRRTGKGRETRNDCVRIPASEQSAFTTVRLLN